jgi:sRNA-binding protein
MSKVYKYDLNVLKELYSILHKSYPIIDCENRKPLAIGFYKELKIATGLSSDILKNFMSWYCNIEYRKVIIEGANRYNLKGEAIGVVTIDEVNHTIRTLEGYNEQRSLKQQEQFAKILELRKQQRNERRAEELAIILAERKKYRDEKHTEEFARVLEERKKQREVKAINTDDKVVCDE